MSQQYGLILRNKPSAAVAKPKPKTLSVFQDDDDDDNDASHFKKSGIVGKDVNSQRHIALQQKKAMEQDASVFEYDAVYDKFHEEEKQVQEQKAKSRYINVLLEAAEKRKIEQGIIETRMAKKEIEKEAHIYGDKEKFVTSAYRKKLEEDRIHEMRIKMKDALDGDVTKKKDITGFYKGLLRDTTSSSSSSALPAPAPAPTAMDIPIPAPSSSSASSVPSGRKRERSSSVERDGDGKRRGPSSRDDRHNTKTTNTATTEHAPMEKQTGTQQRARGEEEEDEQAKKQEQQREQEEQRRLKEDKAKEARERYAARKMAMAAAMAPPNAE
eukprot:GILK01005705.1.p1 GENE.GILK01005705.1~~GILK01005705.1.p1  ORF type:complete len:327 (-),score=95.47 GILK01005705.1:108-1088(-)